MSVAEINYERGLTFEKVWASIQELRKERDETYRQWLAEQERRDEADRKRWEEREKERERQHEKERAETERLRAETERLRDEADRKRREEREKERAETEREIKELRRQMGDVTARFGELVEHLVVPGIVERFRELGYNFTDISDVRKIKGDDGKVLAEFDAFLENTDFVGGVEIKSKPRLSDLDDFAERLEILRDYREKHQYPRKKIIGAVAGAVFPENVKREAIKIGFYVVTQTGDTMKIENAADFRPREF
ncbi:hypothetical protein AGMMS49959_01830 [Planctomycetales bacterium]|nr:hypothetical protein AGMMS49959_01830 [Planctomycetales bacterium]